MSDESLSIHQMMHLIRSSLQLGPVRDGLLREWYLDNETDTDALKKNRLPVLVQIFWIAGCRLFSIAEGVLNQRKRRFAANKMLYPTVVLCSTVLF